jgi:formylglycine-generating enzyme required for sulfatase activity
MGSDPDEIGGLWHRNNWDDYWLEKDARVRSELFAHEVEVTGFWMYRDLVTIAQYFRFMQQTGYPAPIDQAVHTEENSAWLDGHPRPGTLLLPVSSLLGRCCSLLSVGSGATPNRSGMGVCNA